MTLDSFTASDLETTFTFTIDLPDYAVNSRQYLIVEPQQPGHDSPSFENVAQHADDSSFSAMQNHLRGEETVSFTIFMGPVEDEAEPVSITFTELIFPLSAQDRRTVTGLWQYELPASQVAEALRSSRAFSTTNVDQTAERDGVAVTLSRGEKGEAGLRVFYAVESSHPDAIEPVGAGLQLQMSDGATLMPRKVEPTTDADWSKSASGVVELVAEFDVIPATGEVATISSDPYLTNSDSGGSATISNPLGNWSASEFAVNGEQFAVASLTYDDRTGLLGIEISNLEPIDRAEVLFFGIDDGETTRLRVTDQDGREYELVNASTGMRRDENRDLGAGTSTFTIKVPPDADVSELVITVERAGLLLRGPWTFDVEIP